MQQGFVISFLLIAAAAVDALLTVPGGPPNVNLINR